MTRGPLNRAAALLVAAVLLAGCGGTGEPPVWEGPLPGPTAPAKIGVFRGTSLEQVRAYEAWLGRRVDYVVDFSTRDTWEQIAEPTLLLDEWRGTGYRVVHGLAMLPEEQPGATIAAGARGDHDAVYRELAGHLVANGQADAILRVGWEFNLSGSRWSTPEPADFVAYFRRIVEAMRSVPGQRFAFDWNVNNAHNRYDATEYYPGDAYVDLVGVDVYDQSWLPRTYPYPRNCDDGCRTRRQDRAWTEDVLGDERGLTFWAGFAAAHGKPLSLPEWGLWQRPDGHGGGDDPAFVRRMHEFISTHDVAYHAYFEYSAADGPHRLSDGTFPASASVFRELFGAR